MAKFQLNRMTKIAQKRTFLTVGIGVSAFLTTVFTLALSGKHHVSKKENDTTKISGVVDESFSEGNTESALSMQQSELESLKTQMMQLKETMQKTSHANEIMMNQIFIKQKTDALLESKQPKQVTPPRIHSLSFHYPKPHKKENRLSPEHYVPSGTFVEAIVLGGADADASVNSQNKNNGVMLFKLLQPGTLPNGARSHLKGCFVTASSFGDISSERAYVALDKISCAEPGKPIIDKTITGWAFFGGKVGIKGMPLMRDNKVMQWAGISGAMSGVASAAQSTQSIQAINGFGAASIVPQSQIGPYMVSGSVSKAAEVLSNYYVKRAEQYHPVIQVGSGNLVTIVFKDGFYLEPDEAIVAKGNVNKKALESTEPNFEVPPEVLHKIDKNYEPLNEVPE